MTKELKEKVEIELRKYWTKSEEMIQYNLKKTSGIVELKNGSLFLFEKPEIKTRFCFGYGQNGISTDEEFENASNMSIEARKKNNFVRANLEIFDYYENLLEKDELYAVNRYGDKETKLKKIFCGDYIREYPFEKSKCQFQLSKEDVDILKKELQEQKKKFVKRLETYWKKFGSSKLQTWTYLVD